jgi:hypothetical protein
MVAHASATRIPVGGVCVSGAISSTPVVVVWTTWSLFVTAAIASTVRTIAAAVVRIGVILIRVVFIVGVTVTPIKTALSINYVEMPSKKLSSALTLLQVRTPYAEIRERTALGQPALNVRVSLMSNVCEDAVLCDGGFRR